MLKEQLRMEREKRLRAERKNKHYKKKLSELKAFQKTVSNFLHSNSLVDKNGAFLTPASSSTKAFTGQ